MDTFKRKYFLLKSAVNYINNSLSKENHIDVEDILHFASYGYIQLCIRLNINRPNNFYADIDNISNHIWKKLEQYDEHFTFFFDCKYGQVVLSPLSKSLNVDIETGDFNAKILSADIIMAITDNFINDIHLMKHKTLTIDYSYLPGEESYLDKKFDLNVIVSEKPLIVTLDELIITTEELDKFIANMKQSTSKNKQHKSGLVGRKENILKNNILEIAFATREIYPNCTGSSLARKIHLLFNGHEITPTFGTIKEYISRNIPSPQEKNTKLNYELIIPQHLAYLKINK